MPQVQRPGGQLREIPVPTNNSVLVPHQGLVDLIPGIFRSRISLFSQQQQLPPPVPTEVPPCHQLNHFLGVRENHPFPGTRFSVPSNGAFEHFGTEGASPGERKGWREAHQSNIF